MWVMFQCASAALLQRQPQPQAQDNFPWLEGFKERPSSLVMPEDSVPLEAGTGNGGGAGEEPMEDMAPPGAGSGGGSGAGSGAGSGSGPPPEELMPGSEESEAETPNATANGTNATNASNATESTPEAPPSLDGSSVQHPPPARVLDFCGDPVPPACYTWVTQWMTCMDQCSTKAQIDPTTGDVGGCIGSGCGFMPPILCGGEVGMCVHDGVESPHCMRSCKAYQNPPSYMTMCSSIRNKAEYDVCFDEKVLMKTPPPR